MAKLYFNAQAEYRLCFSRSGPGSTGRSQRLQFREILFAEFLAPQLVAAIVFMFETAQMHPADFARNGLRQFGYEFDPPDPLEGRQTRMDVAENRDGGFRRWFGTGS